MKIQTWLNQSIKLLTSSGVDSARLDCFIILEHDLKKPRDWLLAHSDEDLNESELANLNNKIAQRTSRIPLAYIIGSKEFYGRTFLVTSDVLIPRPESEDVITLLKNYGSKVLTVNNSTTIVDIGTGSGILAITAQLELPKTTVIATDISEPALTVAEQNASLLKAPIQLYSADLLSLPESIKPDIILANLPYVPDELITSEEITKEPSLALFSGTDGLDHYRIFWQQVALLAHDPKMIIIESLEYQHAALVDLALSAGYTLEKTATLAQLFVRVN